MANKILSLLFALFVLHVFAVSGVYWYSHPEQSEMQILQRFGLEYGLMLLFGFGFTVYSLVGKR